MTAILRIDRPANPGTNNRSRSDVQLSEVVTLNSVGAGATHTFDLLSRPTGSSAVLSGGGPTSKDITPDVVGSYRIRLDVDNDIIIHTFTVLTTRRSLHIPAHNERASLLANEADPGAAAWIEESETNEGDDFRGYMPALEKLTKEVENIFDYEFDGCAIERQDTFVVVDTGVIYCDIELIGGGDLLVQLNGQIYVLNCTTGAGIGGRARAALTAGTATIPEFNFVWVELVAGVPTLKGGTALPVSAPDGFVVIAFVTILDAATTTTEGPLVHQRSTDAKTHDERGRIAYIDERIRQEGARWSDGVAPTAIINTAPSPDTVDVTVSAGNIYQLHKHPFPALQISVDGVVVGNASGVGSLTPYQKLTDLGLALEDNAGGSLVGKYFNWIIWGAINKSTGECKLFANLPRDGYSNDSDAYNDVDQTAIVSVPTEFRGVAFLIARIPVRHKVAGGGTYEFINPVGRPEIISLLGNPIGVSGSGASGAASQFSDAIFAIFNNTDSSKELLFDASPITTGTQRTLGAPDMDLNLPLADGIAGNPLLTDGAGNTGFSDRLFVVGNAGSPSHLGTPTSDDAFISGRSEHGGTAHFDGQSNFYANIVLPNSSFIYTSTATGGLYPNLTTQTNLPIAFTLGENARTLLICEYADRLVNFEHPAQDNSTIILQSSDATDITQWGSLTHDQTDFLLRTGFGKIKLLPAAGNITQIGDAGSPSYLGTPTNDDAFISGRLEVGADAFFGSKSFHYNNLRVQDNVEFQLGSSADVEIDWSTAQTNNSLVVGLDDTSRTVIICEKADDNVNFGKANQVNPTTFWQSSDATDITQWGSIAYDQTDFVINQGKGTTKLAGGVTHNITVVNAPAYGLLVSDYLVHHTYSAIGAASLTLPSAQTLAGRVFSVIDAAGNAGTNSITVDTQGSELINGVSTYVIGKDYGAASFYSDGTNWFLYGQKLNGAQGTPDVGFYARRSSSQVLNNLTETKIQFDTEIYDSGSNYNNSSTYQFTAPATGHYVITASGKITIAAAGRAELRVYVNSTQRAADDSSFESAGTVFPNAALSYRLAANDTVEIRAWQNSGFTGTIQAIDTNFSIAQVSEV